VKYTTEVPQTGKSAKTEIFYTNLKIHGLVQSCIFKKVQLNYIHLDFYQSLASKSHSSAQAGFSNKRKSQKLWLHGHFRLHIFMYIILCIS